MMNLTAPGLNRYNGKVKTCLFLLAAFALSFCPTRAVAENPYTYRLPSGMTVILAPLPGMQAVCVLTYHKNGVRNDPPAIRGASYLYQYLMMLATENLDDYDRLMFIRKNGGESNARVAMDYSYFAQLVPDHTLANALWLERERLTSLLFFDQTLNSQKRNISRRLQTLQANNILFRAQEWVRSQVMQGTVYQDPVYGSIDRIRNLDNNSIRSRYSTFRTPENIILVICGNLKIREAVALIREHLSLRKGDSPLHPPPLKPLPPRRKAVEETWTLDRISEHSVYYGFRTPGRISKDYLAFQVIQAYLSDPRVSQLDQILNQDNHLNIRVFRESTDNFEANAFIFRISSPSRLAINKAAYLINRLLESLNSGRFSAADLRQTRTLMEIEFRKRQLDPEQLALGLAQGNHLTGRASVSEKDLEHQLEQLTVLDLQRVSREYLAPENRVILNVYKK